MTEQHDTTDEPVDDDSEPVDDSETEQSSGDGNPNAEAMKYRHRAKQAEAERDELREQVETLQRAEIDRIAEAEQVRPSALWASGAQMPDLLDDDGGVDVDKVTAAVQHARDELGLAPPKPSHHVPREGNQPDTTGSGRMLDVVMGTDER